jgi:hypothetical protein
MLKWLRLSDFDELFLFIFFGCPTYIKWYEQQILFAYKIGD